MQILQFVRANLRWIAGGLLLTLFSSFGQTFFIALSAGDIRREYGLSHGEFGSVYMVATLASALTLPWLGRILDIYSTRRVIFLIVPALSIACLAMQFNYSLLLLIVVIYMLRLFGQGMMTQIAFTATARWFVGNRGRAVSLVTLGLNIGEAVFPILFVASAGLFGWRGAWGLAALSLIAVTLPAAAALIRGERVPQSSDTGDVPRGPRDWTRAEVLRDPLFYMLLAGVLAPGFIGTTIFFHQVYLVDLRGWSLEVFAVSFVVMSSLTITFALIAGHLVDRYSASRILPHFLLPLAIACLVLGGFEGQWSAFVFMAFLGISYGISSTLAGALWPEIYGLKHLGSVRAIVVALMVLSTAMGPGVTGYLIDLGVDYSLQIIVMGIYCLAAFGFLTFASRIAVARSLETKHRAG